MPSERLIVIGSISSIDVTDLKVPASSLTNALSGRMSGAVIVQRSGEPGNNDASFWIRGISTFGSNQDPLILIDGVERSINDISVEEIESVSILKDASATAVYGTRAANGVVVVTTRRGKASDQPSIELKIESGLSDLPNMPEFLDGPEYLELYNEAFGSEVFSVSDIEKTRNGTDPYLYPNVNWFNETFKKYSSNSQATLNISGGGEAARYFVSIGYLNEMGNLKDDPSTDWDSNINLKRYNFRSNVDLTLTKSTIVNLEIAGYMTDLNTPASNSILLANGKELSPAEAVFYNAYWATPISTPVKVPIGKDGNGEPIMAWGAPSQIGERNPAEQLMGTGYYTSFNSQEMSQLSVNQDLSSLVKGLSVKGSFSFDAKNLTKHKRSKRSDTYAINGRDSEGELIVSRIDEGDEFLGYTKTLESNRAEELKLQFNYDRTFDEKHRVGSMLMYYQRDYIVGDAETAVLSIPYRTQGVAYRVTYSYKDRYFGEFNAGYNGSENFPKGHRFGFFPAFAGGWLVSGEPFWSSLQDKISMLKIRGSIGLVGAEDLPDKARFGYFSQYGAGLGGYYFGPNGTYHPGTGENTIGVNDLTWEKGLKKDIGFELKMFKDDMVSLEADFFHEKRYDILVQRSTIPAFVGINSAPYANIGEMVNRGVDGTLQINKHYHNGGISLYGNFTYTRDKIKEMDEAELQYPYRQKTGQKYQQKFGLIALGYFESEEDIANSPVQTFGDYRPGDVKYKDINGDGRITVDDQVPIGYSKIPELIYGFGIQVDYKNFDLKLFFRGQARVSYALGNSYVPFSQGVGKGNLFKEALDRWTVDNPRQDALYPRIYNGTSSNNWQMSTKRLYNGSLLRLADVEVGKTFGKNFTERIGFGSLRVYAHVNNAALFSKWKLWDPETGSENGNHYPLQRKMNLGIRVTF